MNVGHDTDTTNTQKQALVDLMKDVPLQTLQIAFLYAKNYVEYGEDVTKTWVTATENASILEKAYRKGYYDAMEKVRNSQATDFLAEARACAEIDENKLYRECTNPNN